MPRAQTTAVPVNEQGFHSSFVVFYCRPHVRTTDNCCCSKYGSGRETHVQLSIFGVKGVLVVTAINAGSLSGFYGSPAHILRRLSNQVMWVALRCTRREKATWMTCTIVGIGEGEGSIAFPEDSHW